MDLRSGKIAQSGAEQQRLADLAATIVPPDLFSGFPAGTTPDPTAYLPGHSYKECYVQNGSIGSFTCDLETVT